MCPLSVVFSNSDRVLGCFPELITAIGIYIRSVKDPDLRITKNRYWDYKGVRNYKEIIMTIWDYEAFVRLRRNT